MIKIVAKTSFIFTLEGKNYLVRQGKTEILPLRAWGNPKFMDVYNRGLITGAAPPQEPIFKEPGLPREGEESGQNKPAAPRARAAKAAAKAETKA